MKRNRLFTLIPMAFLSYQLATTKAAYDEVNESRQFYKDRLDTYFRDWEDIELGVWEKLKSGNRFIFLGVNQTYEKNYLLPNGLVEEDILGLDNIQAFGEEVGRSWRENDSIVATRGGMVNAVEKVQYGSSIGYVYIAKWRKIRRNGDTTIVGLAVKMDTIQKLYLRVLENQLNGKG